MCSGRTVYPWDIVIRREGDQLIFDKRDGGIFDYVTVNENAADPPAETGDKDNINSQSSLSIEATFINTNFASQVVQEDSSSRLDFDHPNPFVSPEEPEALASCAYRYRRFNLTSKVASSEEVDEGENIWLVVRTELDAFMRTPQGEDSYLTLRALNQFDVTAQGSGGALDWKKALDSQRGAVVTTEMKNNSANIARWAVKSYLAGADQLKLGYVARANPKDNTRHVLLGTQAYKPRDFAASMNISLTNGWGIVKAVVDMCLRLPEGKYVLVKDPNRPTVRIYSVPPGTFEEETEADEINAAARDE
jgi:translation initiation factor 3 subunit D